MVLLVYMFWWWSYRILLTVYDDEEYNGMMITMVYFVYSMGNGVNEMVEMWNNNYADQLQSNIGMLFICLKTRYWSC